MNVLTDRELKRRLGMHGRTRLVVERARQWMLPVWNNENSGHLASTWWHFLPTRYSIKSCLLVLALRFFVAWFYESHNNDNVGDWHGCDYDTKYVDQFALGSCGHILTTLISQLSLYAAAYVARIMPTRRLVKPTPLMTKQWSTEVSIKVSIWIRLRLSEIKLD